MSHFTVLVIGDNPEEQLAAYQENSMGDCPKHLLEFNETETEMRQDYANDSITFVRHPVTDKLTFPWEYQRELEQAENVDFMDTDGKNAIRDRVDSMEQIEVPMTEHYPTFEDYAREYCGCTERDAEKGTFGYWENPNAKWDWYKLGGRWNGYFLLKAGTAGTQGDPGLQRMDDDYEAPASNRVDQTLRGNIDWEGMINERRANAERDWDAFQEIPEDGTRKGIEAYCMGIRQDDTRETFIARRASPSTFAVVKDGKWFERGEMGWWACVSNEKEDGQWEQEFEALISGLPNDTLLSVFDCHI